MPNTIKSLLYVKVSTNHILLRMKAVQIMVNYTMQLLRRAMFKPKAKLKLGEHNKFEILDFEFFEKHKIFTL